LITISFSSASNIAANQTALRFRDVTVGVVERVGFTTDLRRVEVAVRLDKDVAPYVDEDAVFWVVQPEVSAQGITGLSTVLSGVYIEGSWDEVAGGTAPEHSGLDDPPVARPDQEGRTFTLLSDDGRGLSEGTPILFRGVEVGRVGRPRLVSNGTAVFAQAFVEAPHDELLTRNTRFWDNSGIQFSLGLEGASVDFESLSSLLRGGLSFDEMEVGGAPLEGVAVFTVYSSRSDALTSYFDDARGPPFYATVVFEENPPGLEQGAEVTLEGVRVGEVSGLTGFVDQARFGDTRVRLLVTLELHLGQAGTNPQAMTPDEALQYLDEAVANGLRARLAQTGLLGVGGLSVELVALPDAPPAALDRTASPFPAIPSAPADLVSGGEAAEGLLARINRLPVEELLDNAVGVLEAARTLIGNPDLQEVPGEVRSALGDVRAVIGSEAFRALPDQIGSLTEDLRLVVADLRAEDGVARLIAAIDRAGLAAEEIAIAAEALPNLIERIAAVAARIEVLDFETLLAEALGVVTDARQLVGGEAVQALPGQLAEAINGISAAADEAQILLANLTEADTAKRLAEAVEATGQAAAPLSAPAAGLPSPTTARHAAAANAHDQHSERLVSPTTTAGAGCPPPGGPKTAGVVEMGAPGTAALRAPVPASA